MRLNVRIVIKLLSLLTLINSIFILIPLPFAIYYQENVMPLVWTLVVHFIVGGIGFGFSRKALGKSLKKREGLLVVTMGWVIMSMLGTLPYLFSGAIPDVTNAFFESMSGYTTTGASILDDIEGMPRYILVWRSLTQWIGGMGMIVLVVALMPLLGVGSVQLFSAESPGLKPTKITPRIADTAKLLWLIYLALTVLETILLMIGDMSFFDAINHSFTTLSTGGFSTKQASVGHFDSAFIQYVISLFMFIGGTNFVLIYFLVTLKWAELRKNEEFRMYFIAITTIVALFTLGLYFRGFPDWEENFRLALFQVISLITTTGFATADYLGWGSALTTACFILLFFGGSAGSTGGGVKIIRHIILIKNGLAELKKQLHPSAIIPVRINKRGIPSETISNVLAFGIMYALIIAVGTVVLSAMGIDFATSISAVATSVGNVGPGIGEVGPSNNFFPMPAAAKWVLSFLMLVGRLELFTVLVLFSPYYWKRG